MRDSISLKIPCKPEYISVVRLTTSSIANNMGMNLESIEDLKVCISEACINAIDNRDDIEIVFNIYGDKLTIHVDNVNDTSNKEGKIINLGLVIIKSLMDDVIFTEKGVEMTKYLEDVLI